MAAAPFSVDSTKITLTAGKKGLHQFELPFVVDRPARVSWSFEVEKDDVEFWVELIGENQMATPLMAHGRHASGQVWSDSVVVGYEGPVSVRMWWSNVFSFFAKKVISYHIQVEEMGDEPPMSITNGMVPALFDAAKLILDEELEEQDMNSLLYYPPPSFEDGDDGRTDSKLTKRHIWGALTSCSTPGSCTAFSRPLWQLQQVRYFTWSACGSGA
eukprot:SAG11_NODE_299_length_11075_cov_15.266764_10_plen_215_part_00